MNSKQIYDLMLDGAYLDVNAKQFFHPSFKKGFRTIRVSDVSFKAAVNKLQDADNYKHENGIISIK